MPDGSDFAAPPPAGSPSSGSAPNLRSIIATYLGEPDAAQSIEKAVRDAYRRANPSFSFAAAKTLSEKYDAQIARYDQWLNRRFQASLKDPLDRVSMPGARPEKTNLTPHDRRVYQFMMVATVLGIAVAWHALASFIADAGVIESLTDNYARSFLISGAAVTGAVLFESGVFNNDDDERRYYKTLRRWAVAAILLYVAVVSATFSPHHIDLAALQETLTGDGTAKNSIADTIKAVAPYLMVGAQLLAEMLSAPVIFYRVTQKHLAGRKIIVAEHDVQVHHKIKIDPLHNEIIDLAQKKAVHDSDIAFHAAAEAAAVAAALRLYREIEADRAQADKQFLSKRLGDI